MPDLSLFASGQETAEFLSGHRLFATGDVGEVMYVLLRGEVEIGLRGKVLESVQAGGIFGEMALIDRRPRSADAIAKSDVTVAAIDQKRFLYLIRNHPFFAIEVMKVMTDRLRTFDDLL